jgi:hypothetical protein
VRRGPLLAAAVHVFAGLVAAGSARAYVRSTTMGGNAPLYWKEGCVPITVYVNGFDSSVHSFQMPIDTIAKSVAAAAHTWSSDGVSCADGSVPYLEIVPTLSFAKTPAPAAYDARNSLIFRTDNWTQSGKPDGKPYAVEALAVTTVISRLDGHIVDADMEINAVNKVWMNLDPGVSLPFNHGVGGDAIYDIQNALTHEFGHFIGLAHTCFVPSMSNPLVDDNGQIRPKDDQGKDIPDCDSAPAAVENTVMFASTDAGSTNKRTLAPDDINGVCGVYPQGRDAPACALDQATPGCAVAPPRPSRRGRGLPLAAVGLLVVAVGARRRARRS